MNPSELAEQVERPSDDPLGESVRLGGILAEHAQVPDLDGWATEDRSGA